MGQLVQLKTKKVISDTNANCVSSLVMTDIAVSCKVSTTDIAVILAELDRRFSSNPVLKLRYPDDWREVVEENGLKFFSIAAVEKHGLWQATLNIDGSGMWFCLHGLG